MKLRLARHFWGVDGSNGYEPLEAQWREIGYEIVEGTLRFSEHPRAPEWQAHLEAHEDWWDTIWQAQNEHGTEISTLCPEFGPAPYMPTIPFSNQPVADLQEICDWMARRQAERFDKLTVKPA